MESEVKQLILTDFNNDSECYLQSKQVDNRKWSVNDMECFEHTNTFDIAPSTKKCTDTKLASKEYTRPLLPSLFQHRTFQSKAVNNDEFASTIVQMEYRKRYLRMVELKYVPCFLSLSFLGLEDIGAI